MKQLTTSTRTKNYQLNQKPSMDFQKKRKLTQQDKDKMSARFNMKLGQFKALSQEDLKLQLDKKMSRTDRYALGIEIDQRIRESLKNNLTEDTNGNNTSSEGEET